MTVIRLIRCNFCGKRPNEVKIMVDTGAVAICDRCVEDCQECIDKERERLSIAKAPPEINVPVRRKRRTI